MTSPDPEYIDLSQVRPGPIRHESLPPELLETVRVVYGVLGRYLNMTLEQFEIGLMRDRTPGDEVAIWGSIAAAWLEYHEKYLGDELLPDKDEKKMIDALISISFGIEDVEMLGATVDVRRNHSPARAYRRRDLASIEKGRRKTSAACLPVSCGCVRRNGRA